MSMTYHIGQSNKFAHRAIKRKYIKGRFTSCAALSRPRFDISIQSDGLSEHKFLQSTRQYVHNVRGQLWKKKSVSSKIGGLIMKKVCRRENFSYIEGPQLAI